MAKAPAKKPTAKKKPLVPNDVMMGAFQLNAKEAWDEFTPEEQKSIQFFLANRYLSCIKSNKREIMEHYVLATNTYFNTHFFEMCKHPKLQWQLACTCAHESYDIKPFDFYMMKRTVSKKEKLLGELFPTMKLDDIKTMAIITTDDEVRQYCEDLGWNTKEASSLTF